MANIRIIMRRCMEIAKKLHEERSRRKDVYLKFDSKRVASEHEKCLKKWRIE